MTDVRKPVRRKDDQPDVDQDEDGNWYIRGYTRRKAGRDDRGYRVPWDENVNQRGVVRKLKR